MRKRFHILCGIATAAFLFAPFANAQTTVNKIVYTLNSAGTAYTVTGYEEGIVDAVIESSIDGKPVTTINQNVFKTAATLKSVMIPASVTTMGNSIFQDNKSLEIVTFEDGDQPLAMGGWTFNGCTNIKEIVMPARLASFGANSNFNKCSSLEKVIFKGPGKLTNFQKYTFTESKLAELDLSGLENVEQFDATNLQVIYSSSIKVTLPKKMTPLPKDVLSKCTASEVIFPEGTTTIPNQALDGYKAVVSVYIPSSVTSIGNSAFRNCTSLSNVTFAYNKTLNSSMNYAFQGCTSLESIDLSPLPRIKGLVATFLNSGLKKVIFSPESKITTLNWDLFNGTQLESIDIPATVTKLGARAFYNCTNLNTINIPKGVSQILTNTFSHDKDRSGIKNVVFNQEGGNWPAAIEADTIDIILAGDTRAYCYKDMSDTPDGVIKVAPIQTAKYTTYYNSKAAIMLPEGVKASLVSAVNGSNVVLDFTKYEAGSTIPGQTAVLLQCEQENTTLYPRILPNGPVVPMASNLLVGSEDDTPYQKSTVNYALSNNNGSYGFYKVTDGSNPANNAYLALSADAAAGKNYFMIENVSTGLTIIEDNQSSQGKIYNLMGIEMDAEKLSPGIYIKNGKKFIVR